MVSLLTRLKLYETNIHFCFILTLSPKFELKNQEYKTVYTIGYQPYKVNIFIVQRKTSKFE